MKWIADIIPFLEPYPAWVKGLVSGWVLFTAVCVVALAFGRPTPTPAQTSKQVAGDGLVWLKINKVESFERGLQSAGVRVTAAINGNTYTYPSIGGAEWVMTGPDMSPEIFKLPPSEVFEITFSLTANKASSTFEGPDAPKTTEFISQRTIVVRRDELPYTGQYAVHELGTENWRLSSIAATISFSLSNKPD